MKYSGDAQLFSTHFKYDGQDYITITRPLGPQESDTWLQVDTYPAKAVQRRKGFQRLLPAREFPSPVAEVIVKYIGTSTLQSGSPLPRWHIVTNYNTSDGEGRVRGVVGATIEEMVVTSGCELEVSSLTEQGNGLYQRLLKNHRPDVSVEQIAEREYRLSPHLSAQHATILE